MTSVLWFRPDLRLGTGRPGAGAARDAAGGGRRRVAALVVAARLAAFLGLAMLVLDRRDG